MYGPFCWRNPTQASGGAYCPREQVNCPRSLVVLLEPPLQPWPLLVLLPPPQQE